MKLGANFDLYLDTRMIGKTYISWFREHRYSGQQRIAQKKKRPKNNFQSFLYLVVLKSTLRKLLIPRTF